MAEFIKEKRSIGMLLVDAIKMKMLLIPSPLRCLDVSSFFFHPLDRFNGVVVEPQPGVREVASSILPPGHTKDLKHGSNGCPPWGSGLPG